MLTNYTVAFGPQIQARLNEQNEFRASDGFVEALGLAVQVFTSNANTNIHGWKESSFREFSLRPEQHELSAMLRECDTMSVLIEFVPLDVERLLIQAKVTLLGTGRPLCTFAFNYGAHGLNGWEVMKKF